MLVSLLSGSPNLVPVVAGGGICEGGGQDGVPARVPAEDTPACECSQPGGPRTPWGRGEGGRGSTLEKVGEGHLGRGSPRDWHWPSWTGAHLCREEGRCGRHP